jgi:hypothetical protein
VVILALAGLLLYIASFVFLGKACSALLPVPVPINRSIDPYRTGYWEII